MERQMIIDDLHGKIEHMTRLHTMHGLQNSVGFQRHKDEIIKTVKEYRIDVRNELEPEIQRLYRRYFD